MPYFKNDNINTLFIHIPKTGGSSLECYFSSKFNIKLNNISLYLFMDNETKIKNNIIINTSLQVQQTVSNSVLDATVLFRLTLPGVFST